MIAVLDASVAVRWFTDQPGHEAAAEWLRGFTRGDHDFVGPELLWLEVLGGLARLQRGREAGWAERSYRRFDRLGVRSARTTLDLCTRALDLSRTLALGGYDAVYLAHAERLGVPWLTADERALRRLEGDSRVLPLET